MTNAKHGKSYWTGAMLALVACLICGASALAQTMTFPALTGRVVDEAGILDAGTRSALTAKLAGLESKTTDQLVVATVRSLQGTSVEDYGNRLFRAWTLGQSGKNNGVLLLVAPNERKVRIEVGYGLEGTLPDAVSKLIIENGILPRFRANDFAGGITRGVDDVIQVLTGDAAEWKQRAAQRPADSSAPIGALIIWLVIAALLIFFHVMTRYSHPPLGRWGRRDRSMLFAPTSSGWSSWGSDSGGGGFSGGDGGFSGGGGDSGGGGASGSW